MDVTPYIISVIFLGADLCFCRKTETEKLRDLENRLFKHILRSHPEFATSIGFRGYDDLGESFSLGELDRQMSVNEGLLAEIGGIDVTRLDFDAKVDLKILRNHIQTFIDGYKWRHWGYINPVSFVQDVLKHQEWMTDVFDTGYDRYQKRLAYQPIQIQQQLELLKMAVDSGITLHNYSMDIRTNLATNMEHLLMVLSYFNEMPHSVKVSMRDTMNMSLKLDKYIVETYLPATRPKEGVSSLPGGVDFYNACLKYHLGLNLTAEQVHNIGLMEVKRIQKLMKKYLRRNGHRESIPQYFKYLRSLKHLYNHSQSEMVEKYNKSMQDINKKIWQIFKRIDLEEVRIRADNSSPIISLGAYYNNTFILNVHNSQNKSTLTMLPLTFHEANPGHHFQESYANLQRLPAYRLHVLYGHRYAVPTTYPTYMAYTEGWALYAEHLGLELGFYKNQLDLFGKYCSEMFRACRLVVDTGIHAYGWSRQEAVEYMANYMDLSHSQLIGEVNRYIIWPGHSCTYKIGEMKLLELRSRAEKNLGNYFDVKEFHHQVLKNGPMSLNVLEEVIDDWISSQVLELNISSNHSTATSRVDLVTSREMASNEVTSGTDESSTNVQSSTFSTEAKMPVQGNTHSGSDEMTRRHVLINFAIVVNVLVWHAR